VSLPAGLAVVAAIFVVLPLGAVWASKRWRDPPREKWGIPPERLAAARNSPELVAYRRRIELGVGHGPAATAVTRAIRTGTAAPPELRAAAHELAGEKIRELDHRLARTRWISLAWLLVAVALLAFGLAYALRGGWGIAIYSGIWFVRAVVSSPWMVRRERRRAEAAVLANAG
jgi:hypothetical protein